MAKFYSVATDPLTDDQVKAFKEFLGAAGWWHWLPNYWVIKDSAEQFDKMKLVSALEEIAPTARALVLVLDSLSWSARTKPNTEGRQMSDWFNENTDT